VFRGVVFNSSHPYAGGDHFEAHHLVAASELVLGGLYVPPPPPRDEGRACSLVVLSRVLGLVSGSSV